jgi:hypothetical protein
MKRMPDAKRPLVIVDPFEDLLTVLHRIYWSEETGLVTRALPFGDTGGPIGP